MSFTLLKCAATKWSGFAIKSTSMKGIMTSSSIWNVTSNLPNTYATSSQNDCTFSTSLHKDHFEDVDELNNSMPTNVIVVREGVADSPFDLFTWLISTLKRRKKKMNKHKLRKRRKRERLKVKK